MEGDEKSQSKKTKLLTILIVIQMAVIVPLGIYFYNLLKKPNEAVVISADTPTPTPIVDKVFTKEEVKKFNGSDPSLPIYIIYSGFIYDVSAGKKFYAKGETYNYLVGKDSTKELDMVGLGGLITSKYPAVGKLAN